MRNMNTIIHNLPVPKILQIYATDGKTQKIFTILNHYHGNLYKYQKSHEIEEITIFCTG